MANPGELDASFAGDGKKAIDFGGTDAARVVQVQPNGRIVVVGCSRGRGLLLRRGACGPTARPIPRSDRAESA